jgi:DNA-binding NtrC family response regulator
MTHHGTAGTHQARSLLNFDQIVSASSAMREIMRRVARVGPTEVPVLIMGETGTGKELVARAIHANSRRASRPFVAVNCGAIPEGLAESELFGHRKGAFTSANTDKRGLVTDADGGTLFLDEVAELPPAIQASLLRFLDHGEVRRVGENQMTRIDARLVAATNRDLEREVAAGRFRDDLYFRLKAATFHLPPLRQRLDDLDALVACRLPELSARAGFPTRVLSPGARALLHRYEWPGNIRELSNVLELAVAMAEGELITEDALGPEFTALRTRTPAAGDGNPQDAERARILAALEAHRWHASDTARSLGVDRKTLWRWRRRLGLRGRPATDVTR